MLQLLTLGVVLGATALAWLFDRETEEEREYHTHLRSRNADLRRQFDTDRHAHRQAIAQQQTRLARDMASNRADACGVFRQRVEGPRLEFESLATSLRQDLTDPSISPYRRNALRLLQGRLEDTRNRLSAFCDYCDWYLKQQQWLEEKGRYQELIDFPDPTSRLPEDWYYDGKVALASVSELSDPDRPYNDYGQHLSLDTYKEGEHYSDAFQRTLMLQYPDQDAIPVQLLQKKNRRYFKACILRGALYVEHVLDKVPCKAVVVSRPRHLERHGEGYEVRCFPAFSPLDGRLNLDRGIRAFLPGSESSFPGKRYLPDEKIEVLIHHHDLLLKSPDLTVTQQRESLTLGSGDSDGAAGASAAPVFVYADGRQHDLHPVLKEASGGSPWQLRFCREAPGHPDGHGTPTVSIGLQIGAWQIEAESDAERSQWRVTAMACVGVDSVQLDDLPFTLRLIDERFSDSVYCDVLSFQVFTQFCRQQALFGEDADVRQKSGQFFVHWSEVTDYLIEATGYQTFLLEPITAPQAQEREWDCRSIERESDLCASLSADGRAPARLWLEELYTHAKGDRWLQVSELNGTPEKLPSTPSQTAQTLRLRHHGLRPPRPEQGFEPMTPRQLRIRLPNGGDLANLDRQKRALQAFQNGRMVNRKLQQILLMPDRYQPEPDLLWHERVQIGLSWQNPHWQQPSAATDAKRVIQDALVESNLYLIQGPPGTGKTTCIVELLHQIYAANPETRVLVVSQQNTAVDNALSRFLDRHPDYTTKVLRVGSDATKVEAPLQSRVTNALLSDYLIRCQQAYSQAAVDGLSSTMAWIQQWIEQIYKSSREGTPQFDNELTELLIGGFPLVGATCVGLASRRHGMDRLTFDICIVDEAGRSTVPELLIPLMRSRKAILIGDHFQLPPSVASQLREADAQEAMPFLEDSFLKTSFFERLFNHLPPNCRGRLTEQFRMVEPIGDLVAELFYSEAGVRGLFNGRRHDRSGFLDPQNPLRWCDIPNGSQAKENGTGTSLFNQEEAKAICHYLSVAVQRLTQLQSHQGASFKRKTVAVITPYGAQKRLIRQLLDKNARNGIGHAQVLDIKVDTVDSFQGSEADIVLYSTVRTHGNISFLLDRQRLNVACSRARENLVFFGKERFLRAHEEAHHETPLFSRIMEKARGEHPSLASG